MREQRWFRIGMTVLLGLFLTVMGILLDSIIPPDVTLKQREAFRQGKPIFYGFLDLLLLGGFTLYLRWMKAKEIGKTVGLFAIALLMGDLYFFGANYYGDTTDMAIAIQALVSTFVFAAGVLWGFTESHSETV